MEGKDYKICWDFIIQRDTLVKPSHHDVELTNKRTKEVMIIDIAIPVDKRAKDKELEILEQYQMLKEEIQRLWKVNPVMVLSSVIGALGAVSQRSSTTTYSNVAQCSIPWGLQVSTSSLLLAISEVFFFELIHCLLLECKYCLLDIMTIVPFGS